MVFNKEKDIFEIRIHARAGQGAKTAAQFIAEAAILEGKYAQAFPYYGPEREGAPMQSFVRISGKSIKVYSMVKNPEAAIVVDEGLVECEKVCQALSEDEILIINSKVSSEEIREKINCPAEIYTLDASSIAIELLGKDIANTVLLGAFAKVLDVIKLENLLKVAENKFAKKLGPKLAKANLEAIRRGHEAVKVKKSKNKNIEKITQEACPVLKSWKNISIGGMILDPGSSKNYKTGMWRSQRPKIDKNKCINCLTCANFCPDDAFIVKEGKIIGIDYDFCKGCGICAMECPVKAIMMKKE